MTLNQGYQDQMSACLFRTYISSTYNPDSTFYSTEIAAVCQYQSLICQPKKLEYFLKNDHGGHLAFSIQGQNYSQGSIHYKKTYHINSAAVGNEVYSNMIPKTIALDMPIQEGFQSKHCQLCKGPNNIKA